MEVIRIRVFEQVLFSSGVSHAACNEASRLNESGSFMCLSTISRFSQGVVSISGVKVIIRQVPIGRGPSTFTFRSTRQCTENATHSAHNARNSSNDFYRGILCVIGHSLCLIRTSGKCKRNLLPWLANFTLARRCRLIRQFYFNFRTSSSFFPSLFARHRLTNLHIMTCGPCDGHVDNYKGVKGWRLTVPIYRGTLFRLFSRSNYTKR